MAPRQPPIPELTRALLDCAKAARFDFGEDTALVIVQHMLAQTIDLLGTVCDLGLPPENMFAAGKVYSNNAAVIQCLREMGVTVIDSTMPEPGEFECYFQRDVDRLWQIAIQKFEERRIKRVLVLDDGGTCLTSVPPEVLRTYAVCGVEQTSQGIFLFEQKPPPFPVISWARSAVKLEIGSGIFSRCFIDKLKTEFLHGQSLQGAQLGIIGLGSMGKAIANLALRQNAYVLFYDTNPDLHLPRSLYHHITSLDSLEQLMMRSDYVVGCSGRNPFNNQWPLNYRPGLKLLSCSGGDREFAPIIRDLKALPGFKIASQSWDIDSEYGPSGPVHIAYRGYPYTFVSRGIEAVETRIVQLETGGLLAGLIQARLYLKLGETAFRSTKGIHRLAIDAQRFVYEKWCSVMKREGIDVCQAFGYDPAVLRAARRKSWFTRNTQPHPDDPYQPITELETMMRRLLDE
jgi:hypothetical protein